MIKVGQGFDVHQLVSGRKCIIGGVEIPFHKGLDGHSDADVLLHAIADAILGAAGLGDIGQHFPNTDPSIKDIDSRDILKKVILLIQEKKYSIINIDATVICELPKLGPFIDRMKNNIALDCRLDIKAVNVKATTTETLGFTGRGEGIAAQAICLIESQ
ncbi:2-C-methyl-D-erythritol 2,4-cyclodiphosphate synthase [Candidatus Methylopumilus universalis]|uniref:2-C-methyl-D-erythritol 2,4-cyclodiphosphate synthase n=1 Tax=Candidatus Methylopumilus universalis TaxID=2588536 RepID=A0AAX1F1X9_9PROT|nr:2-C-methyl-D-erythritol 2,4-cyclodiphosphate synthase [Candidatus Methylopumilus universalis]QDC41751.1 2-C-methyl-D-erythritol 2,4-cyclodiphosphate synthase [Candidatus Methylopumilus universalis]QDC43029.1 2-C-methyl-D-erythritol 2,4-cyclodiphosphate synthase [Candidatus Methylopumilus universalis]QDC55419.1 2-C-methyl-D-erythritol 2,4-cyclodiphosphate synthase [Candidatus Methylopumilus universalis]QDC56700.1 2-C-methyl-D-erythritol 2,4-cyclodiphosphate synthase [Candidatus Methylopumilus